MSSALESYGYLNNQGDAVDKLPVYRRDDDDNKWLLTTAL